MYVCVCVCVRACACVPVPVLAFLHVPTHVPTGKPCQHQRPGQASMLGALPGENRLVCSGHCSGHCYPNPLGIGYPSASSVQILQH